MKIENAKITFDKNFYDIIYNLINGNSCGIEENLAAAVNALQYIETNNKIEINSVYNICKLLKLQDLLNILYNQNNLFCILDNYSKKLGFLYAFIENYNLKNN